MPRHSLKAETRIAKRRGTRPTFKESDFGKATASTAHAAKKSRFNAGMAKVGERATSPRSAPGEGGSRRRAIADRRAAYRAENAASGGGRGRKEGHEEHARAKSTVQGRKKPPSQMKVKRKGGPRERSPLRGG